jgi:hypothetical protein
MDKERLRKLAKDPRFISGIYNYCNRCAFTFYFIFSVSSVLSVAKKSEASVAEPVFVRGPK